MAQRGETGTKGQKKEDEETAYIPSIRGGESERVRE